MDPNKNLRQQRELAERLIRASDDGHFDTMEPEAVRLCELVLALDSWLLKGGFFPKAWAPGTFGRSYSPVEAGLPEAARVSYEDIEGGQ